MTDDRAPNGQFQEGHSEGGRPSGCTAEIVEQVRKLSQFGATDCEIAEFYGVSDRTIRSWKTKHPEFAEALKVGKASPDDRVERSLYQRATGYRFTEQQAIKVKKQEKTGTFTEEVVVVDVERHVAPDTTACIFWLKNRRRDEWRDKIEHDHDVGGTLADLIAASMKTA